MSAAREWEHDGGLHGHGRLQPPAVIEEAAWKPGVLVGSWIVIHTGIIAGPCAGQYRPLVQALRSGVQIPCRREQAFAG